MPFSARKMQFDISASWDQELTNLGRRSLKRNIIWKQTFTCQSSGWTYWGRDRCSTFPCKDTLTAAGMLAWVRNTRGRVRSGPVLLTWTGQFGYEVFRCLIWIRHVWRTWSCVGLPCSGLLANQEVKKKLFSWRIWKDTFTQTFHWYWCYNSIVRETVSNVT